MTTMTLAIPLEIKQKMDTFPEMNRSEVARQAFLQKIRDLELLKKFKSESTLTQQDALRLGKKISKSVSNKLRQKTKQ